MEPRDGRIVEDEIVRGVGADAKDVLLDRHDRRAGFSGDHFDAHLEARKLDERARRRRNGELYPGNVLAPLFLARH